MVERVRCLVTGATGYIGGRLVPRLLDEDHHVRALARDPSKLDNVPWRAQAAPATVRSTIHSGWTRSRDSARCATHSMNRIIRASASPRHASAR